MAQTFIDSVNTMAIVAWTPENGPSEAVLARGSLLHKCGNSAEAVVACVDTQESVYSTVRGKSQTSLDAVTPKIEDTQSIHLLRLQSIHALHNTIPSPIKN